MPELISRLIDVTCSAFDVQGHQITGGTRFAEDLGLDSIDCVELMIAIEDTFGIEFPDQDLPELTTISAVASYISRTVAQDRPAASQPPARFKVVHHPRPPLFGISSVP
jgi:acyl carrier protein